MFKIFQARQITNIKIVALSLLLVFGFLSFMSAPVSASTAATCRADTNLSPAEEGVCLADPAAFYDNDAAGVEELIANIINILSLIIGIIAVIMIIVGGLKYILSAGDASNVTGAKNTILYAVVGLVIVAFAQVIVRFVLTSI